MATTIVLKKKDIEDDISDFQPGDEACFKVYTTVKDISDDEVTLTVDSVMVKSHNDEEYSEEEDEEDTEDDSADKPKPSQGRVIAVLIGKHK